MRYLAKDTTSKLLQKKDASFEAEHFNFDFLRREGLKHIGALSGKIWTDHNVHDPGITILEVLCYALMDLGYRTKLPIQDLLAAPDGKTSNSYFTPAQILGNNPTTILDYRKLLIEIEGVRNAWLIPDFTHQLFASPKEGQLKTRLNCSNGMHPFTLNGLYNIVIQREPELLASNEELSNSVLAKLNEHRNLCEDFVDIKILCEEMIGICADVEIEANQNPEAIYVKVILAIEQFLSPKVQFYTLNEMLNEKSKLIEEVFEGRPFDPNYNSPGFIDTTELAAIPLRKEIHLSDLYSLIQAIDGIKSVRNLKLKGQIDGGPHTSANGTGCGEWIFQLGKEHVPVFAPEDSCINLVKDGAVFQLDRFEIQRIKSQNLNTRSGGRARGDKSYLDIAAPEGNYRADLGEYYSIQNEFPRVYGIGEGGLPDSASKKRKAQAQQLKGFLLFFDQLLVNFLSQLSNAHNLFSFKEEINNSTENNLLESVPGLSDLLQFYNEGDQQSVELIPIGVNDFAQTIQPILKDKNPQLFDFKDHRFKAANKLRRDIEIEQLAREFNQENFSIKVYPTENCYYFTYQPTTLPIILLGRAIYETKELAEIAANNISFVGARKENYQVKNFPNEQQYSFGLTFIPAANTSLTEALTTTEQSKLDRRNLFLDHLLARFSEEFTDYSLLIFEDLKNKTEAAKKIIQTKSNFLSNYPEISSNRGKAFNYKDGENNWGTDNVSGLERRVLALTGAENDQRKYLCNFEVHKYGEEYQVEFKYRDTTLFKTRNVYDTFARGVEVCAQIISEARRNNFYEKKEVGDVYQITFNSAVNILPLSFDNQTERDLFFNAIRNLFHRRAARDGVNVYASTALFYNELYTYSGKLIAQSTKKHPSEVAADTEQKYFLKNVKTQTPSSDEVDISKLKLDTKKVGEQEIILNDVAINNRVKIADSEYRWQITGIDGKPLITSSIYQASEARAFNHYLNTVFNSQTIWDIKEDCVHLLSSNKKILAEQKVNSATAGSLLVEEADLLLNPTLVAQKYLTETGESYGFQLQNASHKILLESVVLYKNKNLVENLLESLNLENHTFKAINETQFIIEFKDAKGRIIAATKEPTNNPDADLAQIKDNIEKLDIIKVAETYTFKIVDSTKNEALLEGFTRYKSQSKALAALFKFVTDFKNGALKFKNIGEEDLADLELFVIDEQGLYLAFSPKDNFRKREYWEQEKKIVQQFLNDFSLPLTFISESKFILTEETGLELMRSVGYYSSPNVARKAGKQALSCFALVENLEKNIIPAKGRISKCRI